MQLKKNRFYFNARGVQLNNGVTSPWVYTLIDEGKSPKCIGPMKGEDGESLADLRMCLEKNWF